jgi:hypothetical protein
MKTEEFLNLKFPTWFEIQQPHPNHVLYMYIKSARKPTKAEQRASGHTDLAVIINSPFLLEVMYGDMIKEISIEDDHDVENRILKREDLEDAVKRKILPKKIRKLTFKYIFETKKKKL